MTAYHIHLIIQRTKEKTSHIQQSVPPLKSALIPLSLNCPHNYLEKKKKELGSLSWNTYLHAIVWRSKILIKWSPAAYPLRFVVAVMLFIYLFFSFLDFEAHDNWMYMWEI